MSDNGIQQFREITDHIQQFLDDLSADKTADWELVEHGKVRAGYGEGPAVWCCPLTWQRKVAAEAVYLAGAAEQFGLTPIETDQIVAAADNVIRHDPYLRQQLLAACRLPETA